MPSHPPSERCAAAEPGSADIFIPVTNPIESTFATVRLRTKVTRGHGSKAAALGMAFKLIESAQRRWRMVNAPHLVALVRAGAHFEHGVLVEREQAAAA
jgi:putative transposase